jgi:ABC-type dipeptide/oligopeptide/nickel transport system permease component
LQAPQAVREQGRSERVTAYITRRLIAVAVLAAAVSIFVFLILHLIPGDPAVVLLGTNAGSADLVNRLHREMGLDLPLPVQYLHWLGGLVRGNLGYSFAQSLPVAHLIAQNFPYTLQLTFSGLVLSLLFGGVLGVLAALKRHSFLDTGVMVLALVGLSLPSFWLGLLFISLFSVTLRWFAVFGGTSLAGLVLPSVALGISGGGVIARFVRSNMIEAMGQPYIATARSKGLSAGRILRRHVIRNAILPVVTVVGLQFGNLLSGTVVIETVFSRPGIGRLLVTSILAKDYLTVQAIVLFIALLYAFTNLLIDLLYPLIDPRIVYR